MEETSKPDERTGEETPKPDEGTGEETPKPDEGTEPGITKPEERPEPQSVMMTTAEYAPLTGTEEEPQENVMVMAAGNVIEQDSCRWKMPDNQNITVGETRRVQITGHTALLFYISYSYTSSNNQVAGAAVLERNGRFVDVTGVSEGTATITFTCEYKVTSNSEMKTVSDSFDVVVTARPHTHDLTLTPAKDATCTEDGNTAYYVCGGNDGCGKWFSDVAGTQEITNHDSLKIPKTGHSYDSQWGYKGADRHAHKCCNCNEHDTVQAHTPGAAATETTPQTCTVCGYEIFPAIGHTHNYGNWQHDSTQHWKVCSCGDEIDRGNHDFGDWVTDREATATEAGTKHRDCQTCSYTETGTISKTDGGNTPGGGDDSGGNSGGNTGSGNSGGSSGGNSGNSGSSSDSGNHNDNGSSDSSNNNGNGGSGGTDNNNGAGGNNNSGGNSGSTATTPSAPGVSAAGQPKVKQEKEGNIQKEVRVEGEKTPDAVMKTPLSKLADMVLTEKEKQQAAAETTIRIVLDVKDASAAVSAADKTLVEAALNSSTAKGYTLGQYLDINLFKVVGDSRTAITQTKEKITVTIAVPDRLKNTDGTKTRTFAVLRVHDGKAQLLADLDQEADTITIETDRFSTYAVVYKDTAAAAGNRDSEEGGSIQLRAESGSGKTSGSGKDDEPRTGDATPLELSATLAMIAGFGYLLLYFTDKERGMTEERKKELVSCLVAWAKQGGRLRKYIALAAIFVLLVYYHSIGKKTCVEWKEVYGE